MKKFFIMLTLALTVVSAFAQKKEAHYDVTTVKTYEEAVARTPQVFVQPNVKPLICEVEVLTGKEPSWSHTFTLKEVNALGGKPENIVNYALFLWTNDAKCDMIVASTHHLKQNEDGSVLIEMKGFPAIFKNWRTANTADYEWLRITEGYEFMHNGTVAPILK